eukprot:CAMPEP_0119139104 /NCGR_PEP_ID=MMETSP1310-20130426/26886_1 /TAXON_ID=464262 /ORGANISM="Genus nov. species nov., Strain RCC2339" /LENGTH=239 /DNA_ID=CAMNT_0007130363 /DNA_START=104 /DNA_END=823 /DNA_ORIENTATION=-
MALRVSQSDYFRQNCIHLLSTVLNRLIEVNEMNPDANAKTTRFHCVCTPDISLKKYLKRISRYTDCNVETVVCAVIYVLRVSRRADITVTCLNIHRLLITSVVVAMKYVEDECFTNRYMAKVGGVSLSELNRLETQFLKNLEFSLDITPENFEQFCCEICRLDAQIMMEEISARLPSEKKKKKSSKTAETPAPSAATNEKMKDLREEFRRNCSTEDMDTTSRVDTAPRTVSEPGPPAVF